ncbi:hypothetical protein B296_00048639 [Ensete ventricosum]|uniref:Uncharacterized protein n=1 Tax=Ensete ventricosum TaxID=4639 RepID=A0A426YBK7_ENSVE|nr:hypothetical protein B296_00048639 [Ensete ventricosum]
MPYRTIPSKAWCTGMGIPENAEAPPVARAAASEQTANAPAQDPQPVQTAVPSGGPNANPLDLFPQFRALQALVQANPQILQVGNWNVYEQVRKVFLRLKADPFRCRSTTAFPPPFPPSPSPSSRFSLILGDGERRPIKLVKLEVLRLTASDIVLLFEDHRLKASNRAASASPVTPSFESKERSALMRRDDEAADLLGSKEKGVASNASFEEVRAKRFNNRFLNFMRLGSIIDDAAESFFKSEIRRRLFVTAVLIIVSRLGYFIPLPGFDRRLIPDTYLSFAAGSTGILLYLDLIMSCRTLALGARHLGSSKRPGDASLKRTAWQIREALGPRLTSP